MIRKLWMIMAICLLLSLAPSEVYAAISQIGGKTSVWENAQLFYDTYGNNAIFHPTSETDGEICFATMAGQGGSGVRYQTIGWKMNLIDESGKVRQVLYFALDGKYITVADYRRIVDDHYSLYKLNLSVLQSRLTGEVASLMKEGRIHMLLDACVVVCRGEKESGNMNDNGIISGAVYTTYESLMAAEHWSDGSRKTLKRYFRKEIAGIFLKVELTAGEGIAEVTGGGIYCYGSKVTIRAWAMDGYRFLKWEGDAGREAEQTFRISKDIRAIAKARKLNPPVIIMEDIFLTEKVLEMEDPLMEWILQYGCAWDEEDGRVEIAGITSDDRLDEKQLKESLQEQGEAAIKIRAEDSDHMVTEKEVKIYMIHTDIKKGTAVTGRIRFISPRYFEDEDGRLIPPVSGGLMEDSIWARNPSYRNLLRGILR